MGHFNSVFEAAVFLRGCGILERRLDIGFRHLPAPGAAGEGGDEAMRAAGFIGAFRRVADEDFGSALALAGPGWIVRAGDSDRVERRLDARVAIHIEVRLVGLAYCFEERGRLLDKVRRQIMLACLYRNALVQICIDLAVILSE